MNESGTALLNKSKKARHGNFIPCTPHQNATKMPPLSALATCCCCQKGLHLQQRQQEQTRAPGSVAAAHHRSTKMTAGGGMAV